MRISSNILNPKLSLFESSGWATLQTYSPVTQVNNSLLVTWLKLPTPKICCKSQNGLSRIHGSLQVMRWHRREAAGPFSKYDGKMPARCRVGTDMQQIVPSIFKQDHLNLCLDQFESESWGLAEVDRRAWNDGDEERSFRDVGKKSQIKRNSNTFLSYE